MSNTGITLTDVRQEAIDPIKALKDGKMDLKTAKEIREFLKVIVNTGKTQVDFLNAMPKTIKDSMNEDTIKAIAGTLQDRDADMDLTLKKINEERNNFPLSNDNECQT